MPKRTTIPLIVEWDEIMKTVEIVEDIAESWCMLNSYGERLSPGRIRSDMGKLRLERLKGGKHVYERIKATYPQIILYSIKIADLMQWERIGKQTYCKMMVFGMPCPITDNGFVSEGGLPAADSRLHEDLISQEWVEFFQDQIKEMVGRLMVSLYSRHEELQHLQGCVSKFWEDALFQEGEA